VDDFATQIIRVLEDSLEAYQELEETLPEFLKSLPEEKYDEDILRAFRSVGVMLSRTLATVNRNLDDRRLQGSLGDTDLIALQPLLRMLGESFLLLGLCRTREEMLLAPLADPDQIRKMAGHQRVESVRKKYAAKTRA
jgi:hypothetical protein